MEVLVAMALTAVLLAALYAAFFSIAGAGSAAGEAAERYVEAGRFLERFTTEVRSAYFRRDNPHTFFQGGKKRRHSEVSFTFFTYPAASGGAPASDLAAASYSVERDGAKRHLLKEVWSPYLGGKMSFRAVTDIKSFEVSFSNGKDWSKAWDSALEGSAPRAVRVRITLQSGEELAQSAATMIR